ncbi:TPA: hypothetical protein ACH3X2_008832 [Trebouxia sp. C0005]
MGKSRKRTKLSHTTGYPYKTARPSSDKGAVHFHEHASFAASPLFTQQGRMVQSSADELKRLAFVRNYSGFCLSKGYSLASSVYSTSRAYTPARLNSSMQAMEDVISEYSSPMIMAVQDQSKRALYQIDHQVDGAILMAHHLLFAKQTSKSDHQMVELQEARSTYLASIQEGVTFLKEHGLVETARHAADVMMGRIEPQRLPNYLEEEAEDLAQKIGDAWNKVASIPPVAKLVATAQPPVQYTCGKYREAHDAIVSSAAYNRALDIADGVVKRVQVSTLCPSNPMFVSHMCDTCALLDSVTCPDQSLGKSARLLKLLTASAGHICIPGGGKQAVPCCEPTGRACSGQADPLSCLHRCQAPLHPACG